MSAYIVERNHIAYLIASATANPDEKFGWYHNARWHYLERDETEHEEIQRAAKVGQMLWDENFASVCDRYPDYDYDNLPGPNDNEYIYKHDSQRFEYNPVQLLMSINCYSYQSCEHDGWEASEAKAFITSLVQATIRKLPGYDKAKWGAPEPVAVPAPPFGGGGEGVSKPLPARITVNAASNCRDSTIKAIRTALKKRSGKTWSVTGGRGTAWGWITIDAPPKRRTCHAVPKPGTVGVHATDYERIDTGEPGGYMTEADRAELGKLMGFDKPVHQQGVSIASSTDYYVEHIDRAEGRTPSVIAKPYWD